MRIIAGTQKGRKIEAPEGLDTRPVTDKIRQSLFNIWQFDIEGARFLDIFSGSGSMALEALSRGAVKAVMVEKAPKAAAVIRKNIEHLGFEKSRAILMEEDAFAAVDRLAGQTFDFIYLDPPYTVDEIFIPIMEKMGASNLLEKDGVLVIRTRREKDMPEVFGPLEKFRTKTYGISTAHFYRYAENLDT
jgi:16S rRNA (guanine(966)-N(2))-methyltransferase RsmD